MLSNLSIVLIKIDFTATSTYFRSEVAFYINSVLFSKKKTIDL